MKDRRGFFRLLSLGGIASFAAVLAGRQQLKNENVDCRDRCKACTQWGDCSLPRAKRQRELLKPQDNSGGAIDV